MGFNVRWARKRVRYIRDNYRGTFCGYTVNGEGNWNVPGKVPIRAPTINLFTPVIMYDSPMYDCLVLRRE